MRKINLSEVDIVVGGKGSTRETSDEEINNPIAIVGIMGAFVVCAGACMWLMIKVADKML